MRTQINTNTNTHFVEAVDNFSNLYFIKNNELIKISEKDTFYYRNNFYSNITSLDVKNPLRIQLLYEDFNSLLVSLINFQKFQQIMMLYFATYKDCL